MGSKDMAAKTMDEYILKFPADVQMKLQKIRMTIKAGAPEAQERISYQMPTFFFGFNLVHFAAYEKHIGFYPTPSGIEAFKKELTPYKTSKGAIQFPLDKPIPYDLILKMVKFRLDENKRKMEVNKSK